MTNSEIKKIFRCNIDEMYKDIHTVVRSSIDDRKILSIKKEYCGIDVEFAIFEYQDSSNNDYYIKNVFEVQVFISIDGSCIKNFDIVTHYHHDDNYIKYSKDEILAVIENKFHGVSN